MYSWDHLDTSPTQDEALVTRHVLPLALGRALRSARRAHGLTLRALAGEVGVGHSHIAAMERGTRAPSEAVAHALVEALDLSPSVAAWLVRESRPGVGQSR
ncbi:MAG: Helix-turn-helix domain [Frankiales bacterium]|nr:Helix-turn-helix domain [Frankiales bacterium]